MVTDDDRIDFGERLAQLYTINGRTIDVLGWVAWSGEYAMRRELKGESHEDATEGTLNLAATGLGVQQPYPPPTPPTPPAGTARTGLVRLDRRCMTDDGGPWLALGKSLFWLAWGARRDGPRTLQNIGWLRDRGVDFLRVFAEVGGPMWEDRTVDPDDPKWPTDLVRSQRFAWSEHLRIAWTLFAGPRRPDEKWYIDKTREFCAAVQDRRDLIQYVEIRNENQGPGDETARACAIIVRDTLGCPVALCGTPESGLPGIYQGSGATLATVHFDRQNTERGNRPSRQPWGYRELGGMPAAFVNNEPRGIDSSVSAEDRPWMLAQDAVQSWLSGSCAYVLHTGAGVRGGGAADLARGRKANVWEQPTLADTLDIIVKLRAALPPDLPNWDRYGINGNDPANGYVKGNHPLFFHTPIGDPVEAGAAGCNRAYAARQGEDWACLVAGVRGHAEFHVKRPARVLGYQLNGHSLVDSGEIGPDTRVAIPEPGTLLVGQEAP